MSSTSQRITLEGENSKSGDESIDVTTDDECTGQRARREKRKEEIDVTIQKFISKKKSESMFELRKLSHQYHPVSAFNKETLEGFLSSKVETNGINSHSSPALDTGESGTTSSFDSDQTVAAQENDNQTTPSGMEEVEANMPAAEPESASLISERVQQFNPPVNPSPQSYMPEDIRHDMQSLLERQIVHEVLQGPAEEIDRVLREGIEERRARRRPRPRPRPRHHAVQEDGEEGGDEMGRASARPVGRLMSRSNRRGRSQSNRHVHFAPAIPTPDANGRYPVPRRDQSIIVDRLRQSPALNSLGEEAREEVVAEVSGLVSRQLVTSALAGEFRGVLELCIQSRAQRVNSGLPRPAFAAPGRHHHHDENDMSDDGERLPSAEVRELREEMMSIRGQLNELKQMMKLSFDLQLDIQRSIRQEVAAALSQDKGASQNSGCGPSSSATVPGRTKVADSGRCVICSEGVIDSVIYHCGHMATCIACGLEMKNKALKCPICRAPITDVIRAYASML